LSDGATRSADRRVAASRRALRLAVRPDGAAFADWAGAADEVDWDWVVRTARAHKLWALVAARLSTTGVDVAVGGDLPQRVAAARTEAARRGAMSERTLAAVAGAAAAARLPFYVVKGSVLAHRVYGDPHLRRFADVDAIVRQADVPRAEAILSQLGYRPGGIEGIVDATPATAAERAFAETLTRRFDTRHLAAHTWYAPRGSDLLSVDLHWHAAPARLRVDEELLWERTEPIDIGGVRLLTFTPAATILHLVAHATTCLLNGFRLLHLVDVAWAATRFSDHAAETWRLAEAWRVAPHLARVLALVERLLEIELPLLAAGPRRPRPLLETATVESFLLDAAGVDQRSAADRLWREMVWSVSMGCVRRNVGVIASAAWARGRFQLFRRLQRSS